MRLFFGYNHRMKRIACLIPLWLFCSAAFAHLNSFSYADIVVNDQEVLIDLKMTQRTTLELFAVDVNYDSVLQQEELDAAWEVLYYYLDNKIKVLEAGERRGGHRQIKPEIQKLSYLVDDFDAYVRIQMRYERETPNDALSIINNLSEETDPYHRSLARIQTAAGEFRFVFTRYNFLNINPDGTNNGFRSDEDVTDADGLTPLSAGPQVIRSVTGSDVIVDVSPTVEGWMKEPKVPDVNSSK